MPLLPSTHSTHTCGRNDRGRACAGRRRRDTRLAHRAAFLGRIVASFLDADPAVNLPLLRLCPRSAVLLLTYPAFPCVTFLVVGPALLALPCGNAPILLLLR